MEKNPEIAEKKSTKAKWKKRLLLGLFCILLGLILFIAILPSIITSRFVVSRGIGFAEKQFPLTIELQRLKLGWFSTLAIEGLLVKDNATGEQILALDSASAPISIIGFFQNGIQNPPPLEVVGLQANYTILENGETNLQALINSLPPSSTNDEPTTSTEAFKLPVNSFSVKAVDWEFVYDDRVKNQRLAFVLDSVDLNLTTPADALTLAAVGSIQANDQEFPWVASGNINKALNKERELVVEKIVAEFNVSRTENTTSFFHLAADAEKRNAKLTTNFELPILQTLAAPFVAQDYLIIESGNIPVSLSVQQLDSVVVLAELSAAVEGVEFSTRLVPNAPDKSVLLPAMNFNSRAEVNVQKQAMVAGELKFQSPWATLQATAEELATQPQIALDNAQTSITLQPLELLNFAQKLVPLPLVLIPESEVKFSLNQIVFRDGVLEFNQDFSITPAPESTFADQRIVYDSFSLPAELLAVEQSATARYFMAEQTYGVQDFQLLHPYFEVSLPQVNGSALGPTIYGSLIGKLNTQKTAKLIEDDFFALPVCLEEWTNLYVEFDYGQNHANARGRLSLPVIDLQNPFVNVPRGNVEFSFQTNTINAHKVFLDIRSNHSFLSVNLNAEDQDVDLALEGFGLLKEFVLIPENLMDFEQHLPASFEGELFATTNLSTYQTFASLNHTLLPSSQHNSVLYPVQLNATLQGVADPVDPKITAAVELYNDLLFASSLNLSTVQEAQSSFDLLVSVASALSLATEFAPEQLYPERLSVSPESFLQSQNTFTLNLADSYSASGGGNVSLELPDLSSEEYLANVLGADLGLEYFFNSSEAVPATLGALRISMPEIYYNTFGIFDVSLSANLSSIQQGELIQTLLQVGSVQNLETETGLVNSASLELQELIFAESVTLEQAELKVGSEFLLQVNDLIYGDLLSLSLIAKSSSLEFLNAPLQPFLVEFTGGSFSLESEYAGVLPTTLSSFFQAQQARINLQASLPNIAYNGMNISETGINFRQSLSEDVLTVDVNSTIDSITIPDLFPLENINLLSSSTVKPNGEIAWELSDFSIENIGSTFASSGSAILPIQDDADFTTLMNSFSLNDFINDLQLQGTASFFQRLAALEDELEDYTMTGDAAVDVVFRTSESSGIYINPTLTASEVNLRMPDLVNMRGLNGSWSPEYALGISKPLALQPPKALGKFTIEQLTVESTARPVVLSKLIFLANGVTEGIDLSLIISDVLQGSLSLTTSLYPSSIRNTLSGNVQLVGLNLNAYNNPDKENNETINLLGKYSLPLKRNATNPVEQLDAELFTYDLEADSIRKLIVAVTTALELKTVSNALTLLRVTPPTAASFLISYGLVTFRTDVTVRGGFTTPFYVVQNQPISEIAVLYSPDMINTLYAQLILAQDVLQAKTLDELFSLFNAKAALENE
ncbi:MAG: hypothetical protein ACFCU1_09065 [Sumerlaeia bacterium]